MRSSLPTTETQTTPFSTLWTFRRCSDVEDLQSTGLLGPGNSLMQRKRIRIATQCSLDLRPGIPLLSISILRENRQTCSERTDIHYAKNVFSLVTEKFDLQKPMPLRWFSPFDWDFSRIKRFRIEYVISRGHCDATGDIVGYVSSYLISNTGDQQ